MLLAESFAILAAMRSEAATVADYLAALPGDRRHALEAVRSVVLANLDAEYEEGMSYGMIGYYVPHRVYPPGYHCDPRQGLPFAGLASQKNYMSLYLMGLYCGCTDGVQETELVRWFHEAWARTGKKTDMGKSCIRFKRLEDLPLDVIGEAIRRMPARIYIEAYEKALGRSGSAAVPSRTAKTSSRQKSAARHRRTVI
jgi:Domain of unknown function (DU1801)